MADADQSGVHLEVASGIATLTLDRPSSRNAFDLDMAEAIAVAIERCRFDDAVRVMVLTGAGDAFCAGGDMKAAAAYVAEGGEPRQFFLDLTVSLHRAVVALRGMPKPAIAAVNGIAAGAGMSLAMACDYRVGSKQARFKQAYTSMGLAPDGGWTMTVPLTVGAGRAMMLLLVDPIIDSDEAFAVGLLHEVVSDRDLLSRANEFGAQFLEGSMSAFATSKRLVNEALVPDLEAQLERERQAIATQGAGADFYERLQRFTR
jgi:2-(1,2-epoxy-1,2-dihydrophenyl)acetyl-CoA isomerase